MAPDEGTLQEIVRRVLTVAQPERIILFGSAATGRMTPNSDIDLLILACPGTDQHAESVRIRNAIGCIDRSIDVLVMRTERFEATRDIIGGIAYPANRYGRILYAAA